MNQDIHIVGDNSDLGPDIAPPIQKSTFGEHIDEAEIRVEFRLKSGSRWRVFAEARYEYIFTTPVGTSYIPVTFGIRW